MRLVHKWGLCTQVRLVCTSEACIYKWGLCIQVRLGVYLMLSSCHSHLFFRHDPNLFYLLLRLEFQRITVQQTQIHLMSSCGSILVHWTEWPDLSFSLSPLFVSLVMAKKNRGGTFFSNQKHSAICVVKNRQEWDCIDGLGLKLALGDRTLG